MFNIKYEGDLGWLTSKIHYKKSSLDTDINQSYSRFSIELKNKYITFIWGDSYPNFSKYSLQGRRVRGINISFNAGPLTLDFINGNTLNAIQGDPENNAMIISKIDSSIASSWIIHLDRDNYTFKQDMFAGKMDILFKDRFSFDINYLNVHTGTSSISITSIIFLIKETLSGLVELLNTLIIFPIPKSGAFAMCQVE